MEGVAFMAFLGLCEELEAATGDDQMGRGLKKYFPARVTTAFLQFLSAATSVLSAAAMHTRHTHTRNS